MAVRELLSSNVPSPLVLQITDPELVAEPDKLSMELVQMTVLPPASAVGVGFIVIVKL